MNELKNRFDKEKVGEWITTYKRQVAVGCILLCLVIVAVFSIGGKDKADGGAETDKEGAITAAADTGEGEEPAEEPNNLEKDAYPEVNAIVQKYYESMAAGDMETLASVVDEISEEEKERILRSKDIVEGYQNISCYTKRGMEENSYLVFVYYEQKFVRIETPAPGLSPLYIRTNEEGNLYIFNGEVTPDLEAYVEEQAAGEDVTALRAEVKAKYEEAKAADEELLKLEERYTKVASADTEEPELQEETPAEEQPAEEQPAEEQPAEEAPAETEAPAEEPQEQPEQGGAGEATAQNRETRFKESVRLRAQPSTEAEYLGTAYQGEHLTQIESYADGWSKIQYNGKECYCKTEFLE